MTVDGQPIILANVYIPPNENRHLYYPPHIIEQRFLDNGIRYIMGGDFNYEATQ